MTTFKHGEAPLTKEVVGYLGPKNYDDLQEADAAAGFTTGFNKTIDLGWFAFIGRPLLWLLQKFHGVVGNWGLAIILLTFLVKGLTLFWTTKSMRSMKAMAALGPQMKALQAKYADDKQRQQAETMALYKQHNVNPVAGCLPILLQIADLARVVPDAVERGGALPAAVHPGVESTTSPRRIRFTSCR